VRKVLALALLLSLTSSCLHTMTATQTRPSPQPQEHRQDFLLWGLVPLQSFSNNPCPQGISRIETGMNPANVLLTAITFGLYWGETIEVWCTEDERAVQPLPPPASGYYVVPNQ
jgi:Bor protein